MDNNYLLEMATALAAPCRICKREHRFWFEGRIYRDFGICVHESCVVSDYNYNFLHFFLLN